MIRRVVPLLCICLFVILHQCTEQDDEDDLQDEAGDRQLEPHVGGGASHGSFSRAGWMLVEQQMNER